MKHLPVLVGILSPLILLTAYKLLCPFFFGMEGGLCFCLVMTGVIYLVWLVQRRFWGD